MRRRELLCAAAGGTVFAAFPARMSAQSEQHFVGAATPIEGDCLPFLAQSEGFFSRAGVDVDVRAMNSGEATAAALIGGDLAIGSMNTVSLANAHENGVPLKIVWPGALYDSSVPGSQLMVRKDSAIRSGRDLNGKTVAVNVLRGSAQLSARAWIDKHGGDSATVQWAEMPFSVMAAALVAERVDAASISEPSATAARETCRSLGPPNDAIARRFLIGQFVSTDAWIRAHPDAAREMRTALHAAAVWYNTHRAESVPAVAKLTRQEPEVIAHSIRSLFGESLDPALIQPFIDVAARYGILKRSFPAVELIAQIP
jgi:NitT/TauT family transport system substrate-binding protein